MSNREHDRRTRIEYAIREELERDHQDWCHMAVQCCPKCVCDLPARITKAVIHASNMDAIQHEINNPMIAGPESFAHSRTRCLRCDHRRKDHDGDNGACARYDEPDCACTGFREPQT